MFIFKKSNKEEYDAEIDLKALGTIVSIEREEPNTTLITYLEEPDDPVKDAQEYYLVCSQEKHNELVQHFRLDITTRS
jgi:hypothetical protein